MKEKIIEMRVMKMKKILLTLLMLMMVVGLFAESDTAKVTATVGAVNEAWFSDEPNSQSNPEGMESVPMEESGALTADSTTTIYAVGKTNKMAGFSLTVYGTALTLVTNEGGEDTSATFDQNNFIGITVTVDKEDAENEKSQTFSTPVGPNATSASTEGTGLEITVVPSVNKVPEGGTRIVDNKLIISVSEKDAKKIGAVASGTYWAYLTLEYETNE